MSLVMSIVQRKRQLSEKFCAEVMTLRMTASTANRLFTELSSNGYAGAAYDMHVNNKFYGMPFVVVSACDIDDWCIDIQETRS